VAPGESLQHHCYYDTESYQDSEFVTFGTATSEEMCQAFLFYYPAQRRNSLPLAMCGLAEDDGYSFTLCGSLSQSDYAFMLPIEDQVARGQANEESPDRFPMDFPPDYTKSDDVEVCAISPTSSPLPLSPPPLPLSPPLTPLSPPPPTSPPPLTPPPLPAKPSSWPTVSFGVRSSGNVADYTPSLLQTIKESVASGLGGVDSSQVSVAVGAGSVLLTVTVSLPDAAAAAAVQVTVTTKLASTTTASALLSVTVEEVVSEPSGGISGAVLGGAIGGAVALLLLVAIFVYCCMCKTKGAKQVTDEPNP